MKITRNQSNCGSLTSLTTSICLLNSLAERTQLPQEIRTMVARPMPAHRPTLPVSLVPLMKTNIPKGRDMMNPKQVSSMELREETTIANQAPLGELDGRQRSRAAADEELLRGRSGRGGGARGGRKRKRRKVWSVEVEE